MTLIGALGRRTRADVDRCATVSLLDARWRLNWWIGADDRWRIPTEEAAIRQSLLEQTPVVRTALRIPDGDAMHTAYGLADGSFVARVENASPAAFVLALVVRGARRVELDGPTVVVDGTPALRTPRPPRAWATSTDGALREIVVGGHASSDAFVTAQDRRGRLEAAFLYPVAHRTSLDVSIAPAMSGDVSVPDPEAVAKGWITQLDRGMRVGIPDEALQLRVEAQRARDALRAGTESDALLLADLEDWGLDDEAALAWERSSLLARRRARRRSARGDSVLRDVRSMLVAPTGHTSNGRGVVEIVRSLPESWRGGDLDVRSAPLREGLLSYSLRWHGEHPALLWEAPAGVELRAPGLDPAWSSIETAGEALIPLLSTATTTPS